MNSYSFIQKNLSLNKPLLMDQENALRSLDELAKYGFTPEQMINWQGMYYEEHTEALAYLCEKGASPQQAINIVDNLDIAQAKGISAGLTRDEVIVLNADQIKTLAQLKRFGLTVDHLLSWQPLGDRYEFNYAHQAALVSLIQDKKLEPTIALGQINQLDTSEAEAIAKGLTRDQAVGLNRYQHKALLALQHKGLTAELMRHWVPGENGFYSNHINALDVLINKQQFTPEAAVNEINGLSAAQAKGIADGLISAEVIGLQEQQIHALVDLKAKGINELTADALRTWQGDYFSYSHKQALMMLIEKRSYSGQNAVAELNNLDEFEARSIAEKNITRDEVFGFNGWQVDLLQELKSYGFKPAHMRSWQPSAEDTHFLHGLTKAVTYLVKQGMPPEKIMEQVNGLTNNQAARIAKGETRDEILSHEKISSKPRF